jgi:hypothetical protein
MMSMKISLKVTHLTLLSKTFATFRRGVAEPPLLEQLFPEAFGKVCDFQKI